MALSIPRHVEPMPLQSNPLLVGFAIGTLAFLFGGADVRADTKSCVAAHASAQREVKAGHLTQAAQLYTSCGADETCPEQVRSECADRLEQVRSIVPTIIFSAIDGKGRDVGGATVYLDQSLIADGLDGRAMELDPGKYHFRFVLPDGSELTNDVLVREGEKNRLVEVRQPADRAAVVAAVPAPPRSAHPLSPEPVASKPPVAAWVATGVAAAGLATFGTFALLGHADKKKLDECKPSCADGEHSRRDSLKTKFLVADIGLGVGAASAIVAAVLVLSGGPSSSAQATAARKNRRIAFDVTSSGGEVLLGGNF